MCVSYVCECVYLYVYRACPSRDHLCMILVYLHMRVRGLQFLRVAVVRRLCRCVCVCMYVIRDVENVRLARQQ